MTHNAPFHMPSEPRNGLDLVRWAFFEPVLLERFSRTLTRKDALRWFVRAYPWIALLSLLLWIGGMSVVVALDLPTLLPGAYETEFLSAWHQALSPFLKLSLLVASTWSVLVTGLGGGLGGGLRVGLAFGLDVGLGLGLGAIPAFYIVYFRLLFVPVHVLMGFGPLTLTRNLYRRDGLIWTPLWPTDTKLLRLAKQSPDEARAFINFLLEYRPLQQRLAARLTHAAAAGVWLQGAYCRPTRLRPRAFRQNKLNLSPRNSG